MTRPLTSAAATLVLALCACGSSSTSSTSSSSGTTSSAGSTSSGGNGMCPDVSGNWKITAHCDPSFIGQSAVVMQTACAVSFAPPFNGFTGTIAKDGALDLSGPQTCSGTGSATEISMTCTPGVCVVTLAR